MNGSRITLAGSLLAVGLFACGGASPAHTSNAARAPAASSAPATAPLPCQGLLAEACVDTAIAAGPTTDPAAIKTAVALLDAACTGGSARGCGLLAAAYADGAAGTPDHARVGPLAEKACREKDRLGCVVATALAERIMSQPEPDMPRAMTLYRVACSTGGVAVACLAMGRASFDGGVEGMHDPERAVEWFAQACAVDLPDACAALAIAKAGGRGVTRDVTEARALALEACDADSSDGCAALGLLTTDAKEALGRFERACTLTGSQYRAWACARVAFAHATGRGTARVPKRGAELFDRACDIATTNGTPGAPRVAGCVIIALTFEVGLGFLIEKNDPIARALYDHVCDGRGDGNGCAARGAFLERHGNKAQARADLARACKLGVAESCAKR